MDVYSSYTSIGTARQTWWYREKYNKSHLFSVSSKCLPISKHTTILEWKYCRLVKGKLIRLSSVHLFGFNTTFIYLYFVPNPIQMCLCLSVCLSWNHPFLFILVCHLIICKDHLFTFLSVLISLILVKWYDKKTASWNILSHIHKKIVLVIYLVTQMSGVLALDWFTTSHLQD